MRIAEYYAQGQFSLAINGYWGPMISWVMVPALWLGLPPLVSLRIACATAAVAFLIGALRIFHATELKRHETIVAGCITLLFAVNWSVVGSTPDLLVGGLLLCGIAEWLTPNPTGSDAHPVRSGLLFGLAYLAKAVALPMSVGLLLVLSTLRVVTGAAPCRNAIRSIGLAALGIAIVSVPWITAISAHYGYLTFSTSARINHALIGPRNMPHPSFQTFNVPDEGRITSWEDPSQLNYQDWSPFDSASSFRHQLQHITNNALFISQELSGFDIIGLGLVAAILGFIMHLPWSTGFSRQPWRLIAPVLLICVGIYLPVYGMDTRYYLHCYPLLLAASLCFLRDGISLQRPPLSSFNSRRRHRLGLIALALVIVLAIPGTGRRAVRATIAGMTDPSYSVARALSASLGAIPFGAVASVETSADLPNFRVGSPAAVSELVGLYAAFLSNRPYYGARTDLTDINEIFESGAEVVVVPLKSYMDLVMSDNARFKSLPFDASILGATTSAVRAYQVLPK
jgi:hypothetical protein